MTCWLISANPRMYNHEGAFNRNGFIDWGQYGKYQVGDKVYIYCAYPEKRIRFITKVTKIDMPKDDIPDDREFWISDFNDCEKYVRLELVKTTDNSLLTYGCLKEHGLKSAQPRKQEIKGELLSYIDGRINSNNTLDGFQTWLTSDNNSKNASREENFKYVGYTQALEKLVNFMFKNGIIPSQELNELNYTRYQSYLDAYNSSQKAKKFDEKENSTHAGRSALKLYINYIKYLCPFYDYNDSDVDICGENKVIYGIPGCGKSYYVDHTILGKNESGIYDGKYSDERVIRTTFHPDYSYTDFVGQIIPEIDYEDDHRIVDYRFIPGPFMLAFECAISNPKQNVALVIEEINRANASGVFGDLFQLLDRIDEPGKGFPIGTSTYGITNPTLIRYLKDDQYEKKYHYSFNLDELRIPANLTIVATMNTSDQNVYTLDTAFKRRWVFLKLKNNWDHHEYSEFLVPGMNNTTWRVFVETINSFIVNDNELLSAEDKRIGAYFIPKKMLMDSKKNYSIEQIKELKNNFADKMLGYLWDDVAKFSREKWFGKTPKTLDDLVDSYVNAKDDGKVVFTDGIFK